MGKEIEYKFLVDKAQWDLIDKPEPELIVQGFLSKDENLVVRVRIKGTRGYLTIKGKSNGISRTEFEYEIPVSDAKEILKEFTEKYIQKYRYEIQNGDNTWEVDVFEGNLEGLILAELEVASLDEEFDRPIWVTEDVSTNSEYFNAVLIEKC